MICPPAPIKIKFCGIANQIESLTAEYQKAVLDLTRVYDVLSQQAFKGELDLSRVILSDGLKTNDSDETIDSSAEPADEAPFELPTPLMPSLPDAKQSRALVLMEWLIAYSNRL